MYKIKVFCLLFRYLIVKYVKPMYKQIVDTVLLNRIKFKRIFNGELELW